MNVATAIAQQRRLLDAKSIDGMRFCGEDNTSMLLLVSGATKHPRGENVGYLAVPKNWNDPDELDAGGMLHPHRWAMDNGCFNGLDAGAFMRMLYAFRKKTGCLFVSVPDCVGDAAETLSLWRFWSPVVRAGGRTLAFVAQDGLTHGRVPWGEFGCLFIGGTDEYKESLEAASLCGYAKSRGLWVHWGRVNGARRYRLAVEAGADSIDGTGFSRHPNVNIPKVEEWQGRVDSQPSLLR